MQDADQYIYDRHCQDHRIMYIGCCPPGHKEIAPSNILHS